MWWYLANAVPHHSETTPTTFKCGSSFWSRMRGKSNRDFVTILSVNNLQVLYYFFILALSIYIAFSFPRCAFTFICFLVLLCLNFVKSSVIVLKMCQRSILDDEDMLFYLSLSTFWRYSQGSSIYLTCRTNVKGVIGYVMRYWRMPDFFAISWCWSFLFVCD